jgi:hypothetical protein
VDRKRQNGPRCNQKKADSDTHGEVSFDGLSDVVGLELIELIWCSLVAKKPVEERWTRKSGYGPPEARST